MRIAVAALCVLALTGSANADYMLKGQFRSPCHDLPPAYARQEPTVIYDLVVYPQATVQRVCRGTRISSQPITACALLPGHSPTGQWRLVLSSFLKGQDYACVLTYEKAHLPPNNWEDQAWEDQAFKGTPYVTRRSAPVN